MAPTTARDRASKGLNCRLEIERLVIDQRGSNEFVGKRGRCKEPGHKRK